MNNNEKQLLEQLNFLEILNYERPIVRRCHNNTGEPPLNKCIGFCCDCENQGIALKCGAKDVLMSHGCTSDDFTKIIGQQLPEVRYTWPIMFLLENPGADYGNGEVIQCDGVTKNPPVNHFYFSSSLQQWPTDPHNGNHYGDYFAYLMAKFGLANVYITNCIKCKYARNNYDATANNCIKRFLEREIKLFQPRIIFCFGKKVADELIWKRIEKPGRLPEIKFRKVRLIHPAADSRHKKPYCKWMDIVEKNDKLIEEALSNNH